jgi:hypothetical protein
VLLIAAADCVCAAGLVRDFGPHLTADVVHAMGPSLTSALVVEFGGSFTSQLVRAFGYPLTAGEAWWLVKFIAVMFGTPQACWRWHCISCSC